MLPLAVASGPGLGAAVGTAAAAAATTVVLLLVVLPLERGWPWVAGVSTHACYATGHASQRPTLLTCLGECFAGHICMSEGRLRVSGCVSRLGLYQRSHSAGCLGYLYCRSLDAPGSLDGLPPESAGRVPEGQWYLSYALRHCTYPIYMCMRGNASASRAGGPARVSNKRASGGRV